MSADNWADCPRCRDRAERAKQKQRDELKTLYGKIPSGEYLVAVRKADEPPEWEQHTFREDYEQGITEDGDYFVRYQGQCKICMLAHSFEHETPVYQDEIRG